MNRIRIALTAVAAGMLVIAGCATAQNPPRQPPRESKEQVVLPFRLESAKIVRFEQSTRVINYRTALELSLLVDFADYTSTPPSPALLLYLGTHELHAFRTDKVDDRTIRLVYHDPRWQEIDRPVPMVLTVLRGGPRRQSGLADDAPLFDPRTIR